MMRLWCLTRPIFERAVRIRLTLNAALCGEELTVANDYEGGGGGRTRKERRPEPGRERWWFHGVKEESRKTKRERVEFIGPE